MAGEEAASSTGRHGKKGSSSSTSSPTSSTCPQLQHTIPPSVQPQVRFPYIQQPPLPPIDGSCPRSSPSSGQGQSPHGNAAPNMWGYPQGGFVNFINQTQYPVQPSNIGENFHLVGLTQSFNPFSVPPPTPYPKRTPHVPPQPAENIVDLDNSGEDVAELNKAGKKRKWTHPEEVRLANAWLNTSKDPIHGNDKKVDTFWGQISERFNKGIEQHLRRDINQLKIHWGRLSKLVSEFNGFWTSVSKVNTSGYSDDLLVKEAQTLYEKKKYGKPFALEHWWKELKNEPKWKASVSQLDKDQNKLVDLDAADDGEAARPIGRAAAKAQRKGKQKVEEVKDSLSMLGDNIVKITEITQERKKEREKITEAQLQISRNQLEAAREQKQAKLLEAYTSIVVQDTSQMPEEMKASRLKTTALMESKLFAQEEDRSNLTN